MMNQLDQNPLLISKAKQIADDLLMNAKINSKGAYWRVNQSGLYYADYSSSSDFTLYYGVSGIFLFIIEIYRIDREAKYLPFLDQCAHWIYKESLTTERSGFYAGRYGAVYALLELFKTNHNRKYLDWCLDITSAEKTDNKTSRASLYNGLGGDILGLCHVLSFTNDLKVLRKIEEKWKVLVNLGKTTNAGTYWEDKYIGIGNLNFTNGNLGIAYLLNELSKMTGEKEIRKLLSRSRNFLEAMSKKYDNSLVGWNFSKELLFPGLKAANDVLKSIYSSEKRFESPQVHSIENGLAGQALFSLELYAKDGVTIYREKSCSVADQILENLKTKATKNTDDVDSTPLGLFNGMAGVGYFFLKLVGYTPSVINPVLGSQINGLDIADSNVSWIEKSYPETVSTVLGHEEKITEATRNRVSVLDIRSEEELRILVSQDHQAKLIFDLEASKKKFEEDFLFVDWSEHFQSIAQSRYEFEIGKAINSLFKQNRNSQLIDLPPNWKVKFNAKQALMCATTRGIVFYPLNDTDIVILRIMGTGAIRLRSLLKEFKKNVEHSQEIDERQINEFFISQMKVYADKEIILIQKSNLKKLLRTVWSQGK